MAQGVSARFRPYALQAARLLTLAMIGAALAACGDGGSNSSGQAANGAPTISGTPPASVAAGAAYAFKPKAADPNGDPLLFAVDGLPPWASFDSVTGQISGTPTAADVGTYHGIAIRVTDGTNETALPAFDITVQGAAPSQNAPPQIGGSPSSGGTVGSLYKFTPSAQDPDGDALTFSIQNKPGWASFDPATGRLQGTPATSDVGVYRSIVVSVSDGKSTVSLAPFAIDVTPPGTNHAPTIAGTPSASVAAGSPYSFTPTAADADGDTLTFSIQNPPSWATFDASTGTLAGTPAAGDAGSYPNVLIQVSDGTATVALPAFTLTVTAPQTNTPPVITGTPSVSGQEGSAYSFRPSASDADGDPLTFSIANPPGWATFSKSTGRLSGTPAVGDAGSYANIVISVTDGKATVALPAFTITVAAAPPTNQPPTISGTPATTATAGTAYSFTPSASDADGDTLTFSIANRPGWASFSSSTGRLSGTPSAAGTYSNIVVSVSDGKATAALAAFTIKVASAPVTNHPPTISGTPPTTGTAGTAYSFTPSASDADGDTLTYSITNRPAWATFNGTTGRLSGTPQTAGTAANIVISVSDGQASASLPAFTITVAAAPVNHPPTISGTPAKSVTAGAPYAFTPSASDADGDTLSFSIANKPSWASFSTSTGRLAGTPTAAGTYSNVAISVSDGQATASLQAFTITVAAANSPPVISGTPAASVMAGSAYAFTPTASDPNGDTLTFSIANKPSWASFNTSTGKLSGTPASGDVGSYSNIVISVSDGKTSASLAAFTIAVQAVANGTATLSWVAPTQRTDGSALTNLAGYKVYWGQTQGSYPNVATISNPGTTTYVIDNLGSGTWYFVMTAYDSSGVESSFSNAASKTIP